MLGIASLSRFFRNTWGISYGVVSIDSIKLSGLMGSGRNGKSTFIDVLKAFIGHLNYSTISIRALVGDKFAGADLDGKIANFSEETGPSEIADSGPFKNLTGDGEIFAQKKFGDPYRLRNRAKLIMTYNEMPHLKDLSAGMISRLLVIPFRKKIKEHEQDHQIKEKLFAELPGIFNFALRGWHRLEKQNRFTESEKSKFVLKNIEKESCNVFQWVENYVEFRDIKNGFARTADLYSMYRKQEKFAYSFDRFSKRLKMHPALEKRRGRHSENGVRLRGYLGVGIRPDISSF